MSTLTLNVIGAGHLGKTLTKLMAAKRVAQITAVCNRSQQSSQTAVDFIGQGIPLTQYKDLPAADLILIATPDDCIQSVCEQLSCEQLIQAKQIVFHCSGSLSSDVLQTAREAGASIAAVHPLKAFADPAQACDSFTGTQCAVEGDAIATSCLSELFSHIGGQVFFIPPEHKSLYHAGCVIASNYLITLAHLATRCLRKAGITDAQAQSICTGLMQDALETLQKKGDVNAALTGPLKRNEQTTLRQHLISLEEDKLLKKTYTALGLATLPLTKLDADTQVALEKLLTGENQS